MPTQIVEKEALEAARKDALQQSEAVVSQERKKAKAAEVEKERIQKAAEEKLAALEALLKKQEEERLAWEVQRKKHEEEVGFNLSCKMCTLTGIRSLHLLLGTKTRK